jgi:hypothetical protein
MLLNTAGAEFLHIISKPEADAVEGELANGY